MAVIIVTHKDLGKQDVMDPLHEDKYAYSVDSFGSRYDVIAGYVKSMLENRDLIE